MKIAMRLFVLTVVLSAAGYSQNMSLAGPGTPPMGPALKAGPGTPPMGPAIKAGPGTPPMGPALNID